MSTETEQEQLTFDSELAEIKPHYVVNQSNELINSRQDLTLTERRIIFSLISLVQPEDEEMKTYILPIRELAELVGITEKSFYDRVEKTVDNLQSKVLVLEKISPKGKLLVVDKINWIQQATYLKGEGLVRIKLSDALAEHLVKLTSFTKYQLFNVLQLRSDYSWRMYEILKEKQPLQKKRIIRISELRRLLNIPDDKLTETKNLKRVVLERARKELKEKTDVYFEYEPYKKVGRKIDSYIFYIYRNEKNIRKFQTKEAVDFDVRNLLNRLMKYGIKRTTAASFVKDYHPNYLEENLTYALRMTEGDNNIKNLGGYIVKGIQHNYANSSYTYTENDYESSLFSMAAGDYIQKIKELNQKDVERLSELYEKYRQALLQAANNGDSDTIKELGSQRDNQIYATLDKIYIFRKKHQYPQLSRSDFEDTKDLIHYFQKWSDSEIPSKIEKVSTVSENSEYIDVPY